jgi:hypothetical protein
MSRLDWFQAIRIGSSSFRIFSPRIKLVKVVTNQRELSFGVIRQR